MLFNSFVFILIYLPITFFVYFYLLHKRLVLGAKGFLVFASLFFYSWWNIAYLPLILGSMSFNYLLGNILSNKESNIKIPKKNILILGIIINISLLAYFKYVDFFIKNFNLLFDMSINQLNLLLPLAISFFTFQQIAYLVDSYRNETKKYDFLNYAIFVTFFPQLIAGPIVYHKEIMPQLTSKWNFVKHYKNIWLGLFIFSIGLFKKNIIADNFAIWATQGFDTVQTLTFAEAWATSLSYTFQLYFDFSGYTDMAIGAALLFNIKLPINFNSPYKALNIQEFWARWHITLSQFLKNYIYIPLGGNRKGSFRTYNNLMVTFIIGGLWHGAGWTFVFWGFLHGLALMIHRQWNQLGFKLNSILSWFLTFNFINIAWVFFRAKEWGDAMKILKGMFLTKPEFSYQMLLLSKQDSVYKLYIFFILAFVIVLFAKNSAQWKEVVKPNKFYLTFILSLSLVAMYHMHKPTEFLYFNF